MYSLSSGLGGWAGWLGWIAGAGDFHINGGGLQAHMAQQLLNASNVAAVFKTVGRETVPQGMGRGPLFDACDADGSFHDSLGRARAKVAAWTFAGEQELVTRETVGKLAQQRFVTLRQRDLTIRAALSLPNVDAAAIEIYVTPPEADDFADTHSRGIHEPQNQLIAERGCGLEYGNNFLATENDRQPFGAPWND